MRAQWWNLRRSFLLGFSKRQAKGSLLIIIPSGELDLVGVLRGWRWWINFLVGARANFSRGIAGNVFMRGSTDAFFPEVI